MLTSLLDKKPDYTEATVALGDILIEQEDYKEAVNLYLDIINILPLS